MPNSRLKPLAQSSHEMVFPIADGSCPKVCLSELVAESDRAAGSREGMARRADKEFSSDSEQEWRLEGHEHLRKQYAATMNLLSVPAAEVKKKGETRRKQRPRQEGAVRKGGRRPRAGKRRGPRRPQRVEAAEKAKGGSEPTEAAEAKGRAHGERRERREGPRSRRRPRRDQSPPQPKVKAPQKGGKVKKVVLKFRAQRGVPERVDGTSHALHEGPRGQEDGLPRQGDQPRHAAQGRGAEQTASPARCRRSQRRHLEL